MGLVSLRRLHPGFRNIAVHGAGCGIDLDRQPEAIVACNRLAALSTATMCAGENSLAVRIAASPIGPVPTTTTVSPGRTRPFSTPTSYDVGRMSASSTAASSDTWDGSLYVDRSANGMRAYWACTPSTR